MAVGGESLSVQEAVSNIASNPLPFALALAGAFIWAIYATFTPSLSEGYDGTTIFFCCVAVVLWTIHFASGDGLPATAPGIGGYAALLACAISISGGYACWGYGMLHGNMETLGDRLVRDPAVLHGFQHAAAGRRAGHAVLDRCCAGGCRFSDQRVVCTVPLSVRFSRIGQPGVTG